MLLSRKVRPHVRNATAVSRAMRGLLGNGFALVLTLGIFGCSESGPANAVAAANDSNVKRLSNLYQSFASRNGWRGPKDETEFKEFIRTFPAHRLELMGVDPNQVDALFASERDGQPFQVKYGIDSGLGAVIAVVFEQQGKDGMKLVGFTDGSVQTVDESQYRQLFEGAR
jgi:hypothetical protein